MRLSRPGGASSHTEAMQSVTDDVRYLGENYIVAPKGMFRPDPNQPRRTIGDAEIQEKREQLERHGQVEPLKVRPLREDPETGERYWPIVDGELRWRGACASTEIETLEARIKHVEDDDELNILTTQLLANDEGSAPVPVMERALAYHRLVELLGSQKTALEHMGVGEAKKSDLSRLLKLVGASEQVRNFIRKGIVQDRRTLADLTNLDERSPDAAATAIKEVEAAEADRQAGREAAKARDIVKRHLDATPKPSIKSGQGAEGETGKKAKQPEAKVKKPRPAVMRGVYVEDTGQSLILNVERGKEYARWYIDEERLRQLRDQIDVVLSSREGVHGDG